METSAENDLPANDEEADGAQVQTSNYRTWCLLVSSAECQTGAHTQTYNKKQGARERDSWKT